VGGFVLSCCCCCTSCFAFCMWAGLELFPFLMIFSLLEVGFSLSLSNHP
jgi:hypothetical protein